MIIARCQLTTTDIRGYILHAPAKSGVGIGLPDEKGGNRRARVFFIVVCIATLALWWVGGGAPARRFLFPGKTNAVSSPPDDWRRRW
ncbi:hypothetical protein F2H39_10565 [Salmonella enterica]|nr:hypothetical protein [Salmonella enterica]